MGQWAYYYDVLEHFQPHGTVITRNIIVWLQSYLAAWGKQICLRIETRGPHVVRRIYVCGPREFSNTFNVCPSIGMKNNFLAIRPISYSWLHVVKSAEVATGFVHIAWAKIVSWKLYSERREKNTANSTAPLCNLTVCSNTNSPWRYPYFGVAVGLVWSYDPESYAGTSLCYW
jgi:hypothetical protein